MTSYTLFFDLVCRNFVLEVRDGVLYITPGSQLTDEDREHVKEFKTRLIALVQSEYRRGEPCIECGWDGMTFDGRCQIHFDIQVELDEEERCYLQEEQTRQVKATRIAHIRDSRAKEKNSRSGVIGSFF